MVSYHQNRGLHPQNGIVVGKLGETRYRCGQERGHGLDLGVGQAALVPQLVLEHGQVGRGIGSANPSRIHQPHSSKAAQQLALAALDIALGSHC